MRGSDGSFIGTYTTIQAGVDACPVGGTVTVAAGTYTDAVHINKRIALVGVGRPTISAAGLGATSTVIFNGTGTDGAIISGFIITGATRAYYNMSDGNGISCNNGSPIISNNTISGNSSDGIFCGYSSSPTIINNTISGSSNDGIHCYNSSSPAITNNTISGNNSYGIHCYNSSSPTITNNTISGNSYDGVYCSSSSPTITNNTISGNRNYGINCSSSSPTITNNIIAGNSYKGIYCSSSSSPIITNNTISGNKDNGIYCLSSSPTITNNIITTNGTSNYGSYYGIYVSSGTPVINYNDVWGNGSTGNKNYYGCSAGQYDISCNPQFIGGGDYRLQTVSCVSPCIDKGTNTAIGIPSTDKDGNPRIVRTVDMGAYEFQGAMPSASVTVYRPDGSTMPYYSTIQAGINACPDGGTVSVSAGTYTEAIYVNKRIALIGIGTPTITAAGLGATNTVIFYGGSPTTGALISGFKITGATGVLPNGNGISCGYGTVTIANNIISGNSQSGISCSYSSSAITNNIISRNSICGIYCSNSSPAITNNTISENGYQGIYCDRSSPAVTNNIITKNNTHGIHCSESSPAITNNTIAENSWSGIFCAESSPTIDNNIITENSIIYTGHYGIDRSDDLSIPRLSSNCVWGNGTPTNNYHNCPRGQDDISDNPQFIGNGDYHLQSSSPCIDKGNNSAAGIPSTDKDGRPRIAKGTVDMGAYEYQKTPVKVKIVDENNQEIDTMTLTTDGTLTLYLKNYDAEDTMIGEVAGTWTLLGEIGTCTPGYGTSIVFNPTKAGTGTISARCGVWTDTTGLITVEKGSIANIKIVNLQNQEVDTKTLITNGTMTLYCQGYDADNNLIGYVAGTWTVSGGIGNCTPICGNSTVFNAIQTGTGTISVRCGVLADTTGMITVIMGRVTIYGSGGAVMGSYATIQEGVNACPVGGTVSVSAGTYNEAVYINNFSFR